MNETDVQEQVDTLIQTLSEFAQNPVKELARRRSMYTKEQPEYWELTSKLCLEKARTLKK